MFTCFDKNGLRKKDYEGVFLYFFWEPGAVNHILKHVF
jgi:hypothetical protein